METEKGGQEPKKIRRDQMICGLFAGALIGYVLGALGLSRYMLVGDHIIPVCALFGAVAAITRAYTALKIGAVALFAFLLLIEYTPLSPILMRSLLRQDQLHVCPAVVVLSSAVHKDGTMDVATQQRVLYAYKLLREGMAKELVLTNNSNTFGSSTPEVRKQMRDLNIIYPIDETGPVRNTHDEALEVARIAHTHGWREVLLVTDPWHMRRAAAVFETAGAHVVAAPCQEEDFDIRDMTGPGDHIVAFCNYLHEVVGYRVYQWRKWIR